MPKSKYITNPKVMIAVPTLEDRPLSWTWSDAQRSIHLPLGCSSAAYRVHGKEVDIARNEIVHAALDAKAHYVLFIGDDVLAPPDTFLRLWMHRADIVTGVYWTKAWPSLPYIWNGMLEGPYLDWKAGEYFPVDFAGCDCLLVATDVFRNIPEPWFSREWAFEPGQRVAPNMTEDFYFYAKAKEAGYQLFCDTAVQCGHQDRNSQHIFALTTDMPQANPTAPHPSTEIEAFVADLGAGFDTPYLGSKAKIIRYDFDESTEPDVRCDLRSIPEHDETFDLVHSRHTLEHFMHGDETVAVVKEWTRILKVGGELRLNVPNIAYAAQEIMKAEADPNYEAGIYPLWQLYGRQDGSPGEVHRNGFTRASLRSLLEHCGFDQVDMRLVGIYGESIEARCIKTVSTEVPVAIAPIMRKAAGIDEPERPNPLPNGKPLAEGAFAPGGVMEALGGQMRAAGFDVEIGGVELEPERKNGEPAAAVVEG